MMPPEVQAAHNEMMSPQTMPHHHAWKKYMQVYNRYQRDASGKFIQDKNGNFLLK